MFVMRFELYDFEIWKFFFNSHAVFLLIQPIYELVPILHTKNKQENFQSFNA